MPPLFLCVYGSSENVHTNRLRKYEAAWQDGFYASACSGVAVSAYKDDFSPAAREKLLGRRYPVNTGTQVDVHEHNIWNILHELFKRAFSVVSNANSLKAEVLQQGLKVHGDEEFVLDDQNLELLTAGCVVVLWSGTATLNGGVLELR